MQSVRLVPASTEAALLEFHAVAARIRDRCPQSRNADSSILDMLLGGRAAYHRHAQVRPFLLESEAGVAGRVMLIHDRNLGQYVQAGYFAAEPGLPGVRAAIEQQARLTFPGIPRLVVGLGGHVNYPTGILIDGFEPPAFGYTWNPPYYGAYFDGLLARPLVSYRFEVGPFYRFIDRLRATFQPGDVVTRTMDGQQMHREVNIYTGLNNACLGQHPYWSERQPDEDWELLQPFRALIGDENLIFAEVSGQAVGFLLWYPDFNQLISTPDERLGQLHVLRFHDRNPIRVVRLAAIGVKKEHRGGPAVPAMMLRMAEAVRKGPYEFCEGGYIFEENTSSMGMTHSFLVGAFGHKPEPFRRWAVYEGEL
jgi:hypothetical protein